MRPVLIALIVLDLAALAAGSLYLRSLSLAKPWGYHGVAAPTPEDLMREEGWGDWEIRKPGDGYRQINIRSADGESYDNGILCFQFPRSHQKCVSIMGIGESL